MSDVISILIADDHPIVRKGLRISIEEDPQLKVVAEASDGDAALALIKSLNPDIAVLDIEMPKLDGLGVAREIARGRLDTRVIFLTFHADLDLFQTAMSMGSSGYILKDSASQEIVAGVHTVASGRPYISSAIATKLMQAKEAPSPQTVLENKLTPTERKILRLIADGKSSKEIGADLNIHYRTVENHRTNICRKLDLEGEGANALLRFALQNKKLLSEDAR